MAINNMNVMLLKIIDRRCNLPLEITRASCSSANSSHWQLRLVTGEQDTSSSNFCNSSCFHTFSIPHFSKLHLYLFILLFFKEKSRPRLFNGRVVTSPSSGVLLFSFTSSKYVFFNEWTVVLLTLLLSFLEKKEAAFTKPFLQAYLPAFVSTDSWDIPKL